MSACISSSVQQLVSTHPIPALRDQYRPHPEPINCTRGKLTKPHAGEFIRPRACSQSAHQCQGTIGSEQHDGGRQYEDGKGEKDYLDVSDRQRALRVRTNQDRKQQEAASGYANTLAGAQHGVNLTTARNASKSDAPLRDERLNHLRRFYS
jgi:hypothetical protein